MAMQFWGVEVKKSESLKVDPGEDMLVRISQAALGESKKGKGCEPIHLYLNVNDQKFVIGTLTQEKVPQLSTEIVLEKGFELSHSWKSGSVYFSGYKVDAHDTTEGNDYGEKKLPVATDNGKSEPKSNQAKPEPKSGTSVKQVNFKEPKKDAKHKQEKDDDSDEDSDEDMASSEESDDNEGKTVNDEGDSDESSDDGVSDEDDESDDDESLDEDTLKKKPEPSKKRPAETAAAKKPVSDKKAKFATPQKTDGKKGSGHVATPYPAKQAGKKPANIQEPKQQTPKSSGGSYPCKSCNRSFTSETGLQSHTKAKHEAAA